MKCEGLIENTTMLSHARAGPCDLEVYTISEWQATSSVTNLFVLFLQLRLVAQRLRRLQTLKLGVRGP